MMSRFFILVTIGFGLVAGACSSAPTEGRGRVAAGEVGAPHDFSVDLTVLSGMPNQEEAPIHLRTARYIVYAGGDLHFASGTDLTVNDTPPYVRTIDLDAMNALWALVQPILRNTTPGSPGNLEQIAPQEGQITHIVSIQAGYERYELGRTRSVDQPANVEFQRLTRALAALAWASDLPDVEKLRMPRRYDFGPDPYARYRHNGQPPAPSAEEPSER